MSEAAACDKQRAATPSVNSNGVPALRLSHPTENKCVAVEQLFHGLAIVDVIHQAERSVVDRVTQKFHGPVCQKKVGAATAVAASEDPRIASAGSIPRTVDRPAQVSEVFRIC